MSVTNPLAPHRAEPAAPANAVALADQQRAIAEVQAAMVIARSHPRDPIAATDRILNACTRLTLAEKAIYAYSRGGTEITGPSIRLAEAIAQCWGNLSFGVRELDTRELESTVQAYCWDVETNLRREMTFTVSHMRHTKKGSYALTDSRDRYENLANQAARRLRACILATIPGDVVEAAVEQCEATISQNADITPEGIRKIVETFAKLGVTREQIETRIQRHIDTIRPAQVVTLRKIYTSIAEGMSDPADWFETAETAPAPAPEAFSEMQRLTQLLAQSSPAAIDALLPVLKREAAAAKQAPAWRRLALAASFIKLRLIAPDDLAEWRADLEASSLPAEYRVALLRDPADWTAEPPVVETGAIEGADHGNPV